MFNQEPRADVASSEDIRGIIEENLRELIPQYLGGPLMVPVAPSVANRPAAPARSSRGPTGPPPFPESDDGMSSQKGRVSRPRLSGDFSFRVPHLQMPVADGERRARRSKERDGPLLSSAAAALPVEAHEIGRGTAPPLRTPAHGTSRRVNFFADHDTARTRRQPTGFQRSGVQKGPSEDLLSHSNRDSSAAHTPSMFFEGSSPTLHAVANRSLNRVSRSLGHIPENSQGMFCT